jgi:hypothetical protein
MPPAKTNGEATEQHRRVSDDKSDAVGEYRRWSWWPSAQIVFD